MVAKFSVINMSLLVLAVICLAGLANARTLIQETSTTNNLKFPALIALGDSTLDTGNNNFIHSLLGSNFQPYGTNFPNHIPTGRFSDGKLMLDFLAGFLGIKDTIPPFLDPTLTTQDLVTGVCFASAGAGYDDITNKELGVIPVMNQTDMFKNYIAKLNGAVGEEEAKKIVSGALYFVSAGTNDLAVTYYDLGLRKLQFPNVGGYHDYILTRLVEFIKELYNQGARNLMVAGLPPIGCLPIQMTARFKLTANRTCIEDQNLDSEVYNQKLEKLLGSLNLPGARIMYANFYDPLLDIMQHPEKYEITETKIGCCGTGLVETAELCNTKTPMCHEVSKYLFFDSIHPNHIAYEAISQYLMKNTVSRF